MEKKCCYCEETLNVVTYTREHLIPKSRGGNNSQEYNLKDCCIDCNRQRGNKSLTGWIKILQWRLKNYAEEFKGKERVKIKNARRWLTYIRANKDKMRGACVQVKPMPVLELEPFDFNSWLIRYRAEPEPNFHYPPK